MTGEIYSAPAPTCPHHGDGQMHYNQTVSRWYCHGWDGEGCEYFVNDEDLESEIK